MRRFARKDFLKLGGMLAAGAATAPLASACGGSGAA
jgi:hypothetical protein